MAAIEINVNRKLSFLAVKNSSANKLCDFCSSLQGIDVFAKTRRKA